MEGWLSSGPDAVLGDTKAPLGLENQSLHFPPAPWAFPGAMPSHAELSSPPAGGNPALFQEHPPLTPGPAQGGTNSGRSPLHHSGLPSPCPERQETAQRPGRGSAGEGEQLIEFGQVMSPPAPDSVCSPVPRACDRDSQAPPAPTVSASVPAP